MGNTENRRRLANIEVNTETRKKSGNAASKENLKRAGAAASGSKPKYAKSGSGGTKKGNSASKQGMKKTTNTKNRKLTVEENPIARRTSHAYSGIERPQPQPQRAPRREKYDPYDRPVPPPQRRAPAKKHKKKKKKQSPFSFVSFLLLLVIIGFGALCVWRTEEYEEIQIMKAAISTQTFYSGTTVEGIDVSNMTLEQALEYWNGQIEPNYRQTAAVLNDGTTVTAEQMGYSSNYADVLSGAWNKGRTGSLVERYKRMTLYMAQPSAYEVERSMYSEELVRQYAASVAQQVDRDAVDAKVKNFNVETYAFEFEADQVGYKLDQEALIAGIEGALAGGGGSVNMVVNTIAPTVTQENVAAQYGLITSAVTNASSSSDNRLSNIRLALSSINGICLEPGESFSFNEVVGKRTKERGYKTAAAYSSGKVTEEVGGGICQVSTTLFNAAVKADLEITERHSHSLTVSYVDLGKDAAVDWGNKDLCFTNTSDDRVYICGYVDNEKRVCVGIYGKLLENGVTITLEGKKTGTNDYKTEYQMSFELASGQTRVIQKGKVGYSAVAYKIWWDASGNEIKREQLCKSNYQSTTEIIEYGP